MNWENFEKIARFESCFLVQPKIFLTLLMLGYKDIHINWAWQFTEYLKFNKRFQSPLKFELDNWKSPLLTLELQNVPKMTHLYWVKSTVLTGF